MKIGQKFNSLIDIGVKTGMSVLPPPFSALFTAVYENTKESVLDKRAEKWKEQVIARLSKLENDYEELISSEAFATALLKTSEIAVKTESEKKRELLANALANTFVNNVAEEKISIFLNLVEKYTLLHIEVLKFAHDEYQKQYYPESFVPTFWVMFKMRFPKIDDAYLTKAIKDLQNDFLIVDFKKDVPVQTFGINKLELLTKLGNDFYDYLLSEV